MKLRIALSMIGRSLPFLAAIIGLTPISLARGQAKPDRLTFEVAAIRACSTRRHQRWDKADARRRRVFGAEHAGKDHDQSDV